MPQITGQLFADPLTTRRRVTAAAAVTAPLATVASIMAGVRHVASHSSQLDIIKAHPGRFTAMIAFEHLTWVCLAIVAVGLLGLTRRRGRILAHVAAGLTVVGAAASQTDFGPMLIPLSHLPDRAAALYAVDHIGVAYGFFSALASLTLVGLLLAFGAARRARITPRWCLPALLVGMILVGMVTGNDPLRLVAGAVLEVPMAGLAIALVRGQRQQPNPKPADVTPAPAAA